MTNRKCGKCKGSVDKNNIIAAGIRESNLGGNCLYLEHVCPKCKWREILSFSGQQSAKLETLCYILLDSLRGQKDVAKSKEIEAKQQKSSKISDAEVEDFLKFVQNNDSHDDFMKFIRAKKHKE